MKYRAEIDGLRALAVVPVILFHAGFEAFSGGFIGVDIFFVISGYLITSIIVTDLDAGTFSLLNFYERRARRILPALYFVMAVSIPFAWMWLLPADMEDYFQSLMAIPFFVSNILFWQESGYFETAIGLKPFLHTWSLAVEEQYYMLFPLFLLLFWKLGIRQITILLVICTLVSLLLSVWGAYNKPTAAFYLLPTRSWEILIGAFAAFYLSKDRKIQGHQALSLLGMTLIISAVFMFDEQTPFPSFYALIPTVGTALIIIFARENTLTHTVLSNKILVKMGLISFSAYLWHQPLLAFARHRSLNELDVKLILAVLVLTIILAYFTWKIVEIPFRNNQHFSTKSTIQTSIIMSVGFVFIGLIGNTTDVFNFQNKEKLARIYAAGKIENPRQIACRFNNSFFSESQSSCTIGVIDNIVGALVGDSHAESLTYSLGALAEEKEIGLRTLIFNACPPALNLMISENIGKESCIQHNLDTHDYLISENIEYIILVSRWTAYYKRTRFNNGEGGVEKGNEFNITPRISGKPFTGGKQEHQHLVAKMYKDTIKSYLNSGKKVILVYPIPEAGWDVPKLMAKQVLWGGERNTSTNYSTYIDRNSDIIRELDSIEYNANLRRVRPDKLFCDTYESGRCVIQINGIPLYSDNNHLNQYGSSMVAKEIMKFMN